MDLPAGIVNLAAEEPQKIEALVRFAAMQVGSISKLVKQDEKTDGRLISIDKLKNVYGFTPKTVKQIVAQYFKDNG
jgi:nucleoside-diphosphate-sugar epimerase